MIYEIELDGRAGKVEIARQGQTWSVSVEGQPVPADVAVIDGATISLLLAGRSYAFNWHAGDGGAIWLSGGGREATLAIRDPRQLLAHRGVEQEGRIKMKAPMAGKVVRVLAAVGDTVEAGQGVVVLEAMKMQNEVRSPKAGRVAALLVETGSTVATQQLLAEVE